jgi:serine/threonine protein kinase
MSSGHFTQPYAEEYCRLGEWKNPSFIKAGKTAGVYRVENGGSLAALKIFSPSMFEGETAPIQISRLQLQKDRLVGLEHPGIIKMLDAGPIERYRTWAILMEFLDWPDLENETPRFPPENIWNVAEQLADAARFLEGRDLVHRDIKPSNILISPDYKQIKLLDFGVLRRSDTFDGSGTPNEGEFRFVATRRYSSPRYLYGHAWPDSDCAPTEADLTSSWRALTFYQIGGVLHDLIMHQPLFYGCESRYGPDPRAALQEAVMTETPLLVNPRVDDRLLDLARDCLDKDDARRLERVNWSRFARTASTPPRGLVSAQKLLGEITSRDLHAIQIVIPPIIEVVMDLARDILAREPIGVRRAKVQPIEAVHSGARAVSVAHDWAVQSASQRLLSHVFEVGPTGQGAVAILYGAALSLQPPKTLATRTLQTVKVLEPTTDPGPDLKLEMTRLMARTFGLVAEAVTQSEESAECPEIVDLWSK